MLEAPESKKVNKLSAYWASGLGCLLRSGGAVPGRVDGALLAGWLSIGGRRGIDSRPLARRAGDCREQDRQDDEGAQGPRWRG